MSRFGNGVAAVVLSAGLALAGCSSDSPEQRASDRAALQNVVDSAAATVTEFRTGSEAAKVNALLAKARGVVVYPKITRAALIGGGSGGIGVLAGRSEQGRWSSPAFISFGAASFGLQAGVDTFSLIAIVNRAETVQQIAAGNFVFGSSAKAGSGEGDATSQSIADTSADIVYFTRSIGGAYAGINIGGARNEPLDDKNEIYYDRPAPSAKIVDGHIRNPNAQPLVDALAR